MSLNRLGTLCAGVVGLGWLVAVIINLAVWLPQTATADAGFWDESYQFLGFVQANAVSWRFFHIGTTLALVALVVLIPLLSQLHQESDRWLTMMVIGLVGALFALIASLFDHLATPILARYAQLPTQVGNAQGSRLIAGIVWEAIEPWRDAGLKTVSFWFLGFWLWWLGGAWRQQAVAHLGRFSQITGLALLILALIETMIPAPWVYQIGETGIGGLAVLLIPVWGLWTAVWFWQRELAENPLEK